MCSSFNDISSDGNGKVDNLPFDKKMSNDFFIYDSLVHNIVRTDVIDKYCSCYGLTSMY